MSDEVWWYAGAAACFAFTVLGVLVNGLIIATFVRFPRFRNPIGLFILYSFVVPSNALLFVNFGHWKYDKSLCIADRVSTYAVFLFAMNLNCYIAINRCIKVCSSGDLYDRLFSKRNVHCLTAVTAAYTFSMPLLFCYGYGGRLVYSEEKEQCILKFDKLWIVYIGNFLLNLVIIFFCYAKIYFTFYRSRATLGDQHPGNNRLLKMLVVTTALYFAGFAFPLTMGFISFLKKDKTNYSIASSVQAFFFKVPIYSNVVSNPIIYFIMNDQYRTAIKQLFWSKARQDESTVQTTPIN